MSSPRVQKIVSGTVLGNNLLHIRASPMHRKPDWFKNIMEILGADRARGKKQNDTVKRRLLMGGCYFFVSAARWLR